MEPADMSLAGLAAVVWGTRAKPLVLRGCSRGLVPGLAEAEEGRAKAAAARQEAEKGKG
jgi:hypothetical protein